MDEHKEMKEKELTKGGLYELGYLLSSLIPEENVGEEVSKIKDILESEGMIIASEEPKLKILLYEMRHVIVNKNVRFSSAYFGSIVFQTTPEGVGVIKERLGKNEGIIRMLIIARTKESLIVRERKISTRTKEYTEMKKRGQKDSTVSIDEAELEKAIEKLTVA